MKRSIPGIAVLFFVMLKLTATPLQQFEVASVKPTQVAGGVRGGCHGIDSRIGPNDARSSVPLGRCVVFAARLSHMIGIAYGVDMDMLKGGPDWLAGGNDRYDVEAKVDDPSRATEKQLIAMFQTLLAERFKLKFHRESQDMPGFALVVGKNAPKLKEASETDERKLEIRAAGSGEIEAIKKAAGETDALRNSGTGAPMLLTAQKISLTDLVDALTPFAHAHILDETNLKGLYNLRLTWESGESLSGPIQNQLGLRLESRKVPVDYIVIDHAEKPAIQ